jgi:hypothetical protein
MVDCHPSLKFKRGEGESSGDVNAKILLQQKGFRSFLKVPLFERVSVAKGDRRERNVV